MPAIISTVSADGNYSVYERFATTDVPVITKKITLKGGANVAIPVRGTGVQKETPLGMKTIVTDEDLALLEKDSAFVRHCRKGFLIVVREKEKVKDAVKSMTPKDKSAPITSTVSDERIGGTIKAQPVNKGI